MTFRDSMDEALALIDQHADRVRVGGGAPVDLIRSAQTALGVEFPEDYQRFLARFGTLSFDDADVYGLVSPAFEATMPDAVGLTLKDRASGLDARFVLVHMVGDGTMCLLDCETDEVVELHGIGDEPVVRSSSFGDFLLETIGERLSWDE
jgi:hypothetical protein